MTPTDDLAKLNENEMLRDQRDEMAVVITRLMRQLGKIPGGRDHPAYRAAWTFLTANNLWGDAMREGYDKDGAV